MNTASALPLSAEKPLPDVSVATGGAGGGNSFGMGVEEQSRKLRQIANIRTVEELDGWMDGMKTRAAIPGEMAALMQRRIELQTEVTR